jgi:hypothetical protein
VRIDTVAREDVSVLCASEPGRPEAIGEAAKRAFERVESVIALRGRKMFGYWDPAAAEYHACGSLLEDDDPERLGLTPGVIPGGLYRRGRLSGEDVYSHIGPAFDELSAGVEVDPERPWLEFYRRRDEVDVHVPLRSS